MTQPEPFSHPLPLGDERLVGLRLCEIDALVEVATFELDETPDDFWSDQTRHDLHTTIEKLKRVQD